MALVQKLPCTVRSLVPHGDHVYTVELAPHAGVQVPRFLPGQFLHLALDPYDPTRFWPESRVFSIANSPDERNLLRISYSVRGRYTARMESELMVGRDVWVKLPYGDFVIDASRPAVLFAGGTGITAFASFLLRSGTLAQPVFLAYGARRPELLLYRDQLKQRSAACPLLRTKLFCETPGPGTSHGRVSASAIWPELGPPAGTPCYLSGPPEMLAALTTELKGLGVADSRIRIDAWE